MKAVASFADIVIDRLPYPQRNDKDMILVQIDKYQVTSNGIMNALNAVKERSQKEKVKAVRRYITGNSVSDLRSTKDIKAAETLSNAIRQMTKLLSNDQQKTYWENVTQYYVEKM